MDRYPVNSLFNNFTNIFNRIEKDEDTPVLSFFRSLSEKDTDPQDISIQNHPNQGEQTVADDQADLNSKAFTQKCSTASLSNTASAEIQESMDLLDNFSKQIYSSTDINPISTAAASDQTGEAMPITSNLVIPDGDFVTNPDNNKIQPKEESLSSLSLDTCYVESDKQSCSETGETFLKVGSDKVLLKLEASTSECLNETQKGGETNGVQELSKLKMKNNVEQDQDESDNLAQKVEQSQEELKEEKKDILQEDSNSELLDSPTSPGNLENAFKPTKRVTFSPDLKLDKPHQLPSIFSGLKGIKKEAHDQQKEAHDQQKEAHDQPKRPFLMKQASVKRALFSEKHSKSEAKGSILEQLSQLLSFDAGKVGVKKSQEATTSPPLSPSSEVPIAEMPPVEESVEDSDVASSDESGKLTNTETALSAFKAFFTPKPAKKDTLDHIDLDAVKRAFNPETIRAIFDRNSSKSPDNKNLFETKPPDSEERTPGRLQAVWPPPKPKDEEEKIGLKYTEAEHQAALLHLKRECKEELDALEADFKLQLYHLREEKEESVSRLQAAVADLKKTAKCSHGELRDVAVSTEDNFPPRIFRTVCIQTDRETFIKPVEEPELNKDLCPQPNVPKKLDLASITNSLSGKQEPSLSPLLPLPPSLPLPPPPPPSLPLPPPPPPSLPLPPPPPPPLSVQSGFDSETTSKPSPSLPSPSECSSKPDLSVKCPSRTQGNGPPPPPALSAGLFHPPPLPGLVPFPPFGGGLFLSRAEERPQRKPRVEPICPMKPLYWTRIQIQDSRNDTLWSLLKEPDIVNTNEFAEMFAKMASPIKRKPLSEAYNKTAKGKKIIKVLDSKRSQAVGILISSLHLEMKDIQKAILMMDNSVVDLDAIEALYENSAQPEELAKIRKHYETSDEEHVRLLDKPEQFLYELSLIPQFSLRARCILLQSTFTDAVASIQRKTNIVLQVCKGLLERESVRDVLGLVLAFGNYMNGGSRHRGQADGFDLEILPKLKDVKSRDNCISLVDYVVSYYLHNLDQNVGTENCVFPLPEPQDVFLASQVKFEDLSKELRKLSKDVEGCEKDVQSVCLTSSQEYIHPFREKMEAFISSAQKEKIATEHHLLSAQKSFHDLVQYFGMKPRSGEQDVLPGHVFMLWFEFCNDFKTRWKRENKTISNKRLKEAQQSVRNITADKKVETKQVNANGLKERLRLKEASLSSTIDTTGPPQ